MTCLVPSERVIVLMSLALALPLAVTVPVAVTGGQALAHAPEQADMFLPSFTHRYTARPDLSVRNAPVEPAVVLMTVPVVDALPLDEFAAGSAPAADPVVLELLHAAASSAAATGTPIFTGMGIRVSNELAMFVVLRSGRLRRPFLGERGASPLVCAAET